MNDTPLVYHNFFREFSGTTAEEVVTQLYEDAKKGTGESKDQWWKRQQLAWPAADGGLIPESNEAGAAQKMLDALVAADALIAGPKPPKQFRAFGGAGGGGRCA